MKKMTYSKDNSLTQETIEEMFQDFKNSLSLEQWTDEQFLYKKSIELESKNLLLACRIMQRVKNLAPTMEKYQRELMRLNHQVHAYKKTNIRNKMKNSKLYKIQSRVKCKITEKLHHPTVVPFKRPLVAFVLLPFLAFSFYQLVIASPRYESRSQLIIQQPDAMATMDASMALLTGLGGGGMGGSDSELMKAYIQSGDMLSFLQEGLQIREHYSHSSIDFFSKLPENSSKEDFMAFYLDHLNVEIDEISGVITVLIQGFTPEYANQLNQAIINQAEWFINSVGHQLAEAQLEFIQEENILVTENLKKAKNDLLLFQQKNVLLDPEAEGLAFQQITYSIEAELVQKKSELKALKLSMSENAPMVVLLNAQVQALQTQLNIERNRLSFPGNTNNVGNGLFSEENNNASETSSLSVSQMLSRFSELKIALELALQGYTSSQISLEKSRVEAYRQLKYLIVVEEATLPEENKYPSSYYNMALFLAISLMLFGISRIMVAIIKELG